MKFWYFIIAVLCGIIIGNVALNMSSWFMETYDLEDVDISVSEECENTYYNKLTDYQKKIYKVILNPVSKAKEKFAIKNIDMDEFNENFSDAFIAVHYDYPEYFWFTGGSSWSYYETYLQMFLKMDGKVEIRPQYYSYTSSAFNAEKKHNQLTARVNEVAALAENHSTDAFERIVFVHDYLIENAYYDYDALEEYEKTSHNPSCEYIYSAYGCLVNGKTVCAGFAKAFQMILNELDYECSYITGDAGGPHAWNCVYLDGEGYYIDVTWDNRDFENEIPFYSYTLINDETLKTTHELDTRFTPPVCTATEYNYYIRRNYYVDKYSYSKVSKIIAAQSESEAVYIKFKSLSDLERAYKDISANVKKGNIAALKSYEAAYTNNKHCTLTIIK